MRRKNHSRVWEEIGSVIRQNKGRAILLVICMTASVILALIPPQILRYVVDDKLIPGRQQGLFVLAVLYVAASVLGAAAEFGKGIMLTVIGEKYIHRIRTDLMEKLNRLPLEKLTHESEGEVTGRFVNDVESVGSLVSDGIASMVTDLLKIIGIVLSVLLFSWKMALLVAALVPAVFFLTRLFQRMTLGAQEKNLSQMGQMNTVLTDSIDKAQTIKVYHREAWMQGIYLRELEDNYRTNASIYLLDASYSPMIQVIRAAAIALIAAMASQHLHLVTISAGVAAAAIDLITRLFDPINTLGMEFQNIQRGISGIRRIDLFLDQEQEAEHTQVLDAEELEGEVRFDHVSFAYRGGPTLFHDFCLTMRRGDRVTVIGRTGAGKTTLVGLLTGLFSPTEGRVVIGGVDTREITDAQKRMIFGYVQQDFVEIPGSVLMQVTMGDERVTEDMALEAIGKVGMIDELLALPDGLDTDMSRAGLSQGQRILLQIARAIAPRPSILIFDESTAGLDAVTEKRIDEALVQAGENRIVLIISHRKTEGMPGGRVVRL